MVFHYDGYRHCQHPADHDTVSSTVAVLPIGNLLSP